MKRRNYATDGTVQPQVFMEDAKGNQYDISGNIIPPAQDPVNSALSVARRETDPYLMVPGHEHLTRVPPVSPPSPEYVPGEAISAATQPSRDVFWQGVEQFRNPQTEPKTPERAWELLSGAGLLGLGALGTGVSGAIGGGVELLPTWLTGNQNQRNKLASELNEMAMFADPFLGPEAAAATIPVQRVGGIRNAAAIEGDLAKGRMAERGPSALYDPLRVSSGVDPTEAGKALANAADTAIAKVGEALDPALKAAQEATGTDQVAAAMAVAQKPAPPPPIGHNVPPAKTLLETFDEENLPGVVVSPKPGTAGFTFSTPDIIGMPVPPPMYNPIRKADIRPIARDAEKILNSSAFRKYAEEQLGVSGFTVTPTVGTWMGNPEPSFIIQGGNITPENASKLTNALGFGFQQDAAVLTMHNPSISDGIPTMLMGTGQELTKADVNRIMKAAKNQGLDFTLTKDGRAVRFSHFDGPETLPQFADKVMAIAEEARMPELLGVKTQGDLINADQYINGLVPEAPSGAGVEYGPGQSSDLLGGLVDTVLIPFSKSAAGQGYRLSPERLGQQYAIGPDIEARIAQGLAPRGDRSTVPLMEGKEKLPIKGTGARGEVVVDDVIDALSNRAARKGYIEPGDYSPKAMSAIAKTIADEVYHHVTTSGKSALGWYDATLKKAKGAYNRIFPELASDPQRNMLFDAILGITSQGADVYTNSKNAVRLYNLVRNGEMTLPQAVSKLTGTLGKETAAVEQNLLKLDELLGRNGYDRMANLFNQTKTVGEWNKIFRDDKSLHVKGKPFQIKGGKNQKVTGWMVFGPKIGSFINNLHGDYSTLTADLWFTRSWNRILGNSFIHDAGTEAAQFRDFRDALKAEYAKTHDIRDPLMRQKYSPDVAGYSQKLVRGKQSGEPWEFGQDVASMSPEEFNALLNDPDAMLQYAYNMEQVYRKGGYKEKSDLRRRAKNWVEGRENAQADPRSDLERAFQQDTIEQTQKLLQKRGLDISVADIQAALWYYEKELFGKYGVASEKAAPADYFDAAQKTLKSVDEGNLYKNEASIAKGEVSPEQRQANFQSAFGQTYLKDPQGNPMRLYHLTPADIKSFSVSKKNRAGPVVYLSPYPEFQPAHHQAGIMGERGEFTGDFREGANVMPVYADVRNPLVLDHPRKIREAAAKYQNGDREFPRYVSPEAKAAMEADGYDSIIFGGENPIPYGDRPFDARLGHQEARDEEFIIFDPKKIKSAIGNKGTYDLTKGDITKAFGGALVDDEDIDNALRIARATGGRAGYATDGSVAPQVMMEDAKGNKYDAQGNVIPPTAPTGPNPQRDDSAFTNTAPENYKTDVQPFIDYAVTPIDRPGMPSEPDLVDVMRVAAQVAAEGQPTDDRGEGNFGRRRAETVRSLVGASPEGYQSDYKGPFTYNAGDTANFLNTLIDFSPYGALEYMHDIPYEAGRTGDYGNAAVEGGLGALMTAPGMTIAGRGLKKGYEAVKSSPKLAAGIAGVAGLTASSDEAEAGPARWFSKAMEVAGALPMEKMTGEQALAMLRKGVPSEELKWTGTEAFLSGRPQVSKGELLEHLKNNRVQVNEVVLGGSDKPTRLQDILLSQIPEPIRAKYRSATNDALTLQAKYVNEANRLLAPDKTIPYDKYAEYKSLMGKADQAKEVIHRLGIQMRQEYVDSIGGLGRPTQYGPGSRYGDRFHTPGGKNYQETTFNIPPQKVELVEWPVIDAFGNVKARYDSKEAAERVARTSGSTVGEPLTTIIEKGYRSSHWPELNTLGHIRTQMLEAELPGSNRPLKLFNVDEAQSDYAQDVRKYGLRENDGENVSRKLNEFTQQMADRWVTQRAEQLYQGSPELFSGIEEARNGAMRLANQRGATAIAEELGVADEFEQLVAAEKRYRKGLDPAPYVTNTQHFTDFSIKKALDQAIDSGADYFTFTPGEVHADRYDLARDLAQIEYEPGYYGTYSISAIGKNGKNVLDEDMDIDEIEEYFGKEIAKKIKADEGRKMEDRPHRKWRVLENEQIKAKGDAMVDAYNNIYKKRVEKVVKEATGKKVTWEVLPAKTANGIVPRLGFRIDEDVKNARFSDFARGGSVNKALALTADL